MTLSISDQNKLDSFWSYCVKNQYFNIGYPESADFDYTILERFMRFSINNCGDWGEYCNYLLNSFDFEKEVMEYFAQLFKIPFEESWGVCDQWRYRRQYVWLLSGSGDFPQRYTILLERYPLLRGKNRQAVTHKIDAC